MNARDVKPDQRVMVDCYGAERPAVVLQGPVSGSQSSVCYVRMLDTHTTRWAFAESLTLVPEVIA